MSGVPHTRSLCSRCLESFTPDAAGATVCPTCLARESDRSSPQPGLDPEVRDPILNAPAPPTRPPPNGHQTSLTQTRVSTRPTTLSAAIMASALRQPALAKEWCEGRMPWFRILLWLYLASTFARHLGSSEPYRSMFDGINLGIHEAGHAIFRHFGQWFHIAGGTITQLAAPIATLFIFRKQKDFFGMSVALCWFATNLWGVSVYMGDARALALPLVAPGMGMMPGGDTSGQGGIIHDWNYLLGAPGLLRYDTIFSGLIAVLAVVTMLIGLTIGAWLIVRMLKSKASPKLDFENF